MTPKVERVCAGMQRTSMPGQAAVSGRLLQEPNHRGRALHVLQDLQEGARQEAQGPH